MLLLYCYYVVINNRILNEYFDNNKIEDNYMNV